MKQFLFELKKVYQSRLIRTLLLFLIAAEFLVVYRTSTPMPGEKDCRYFYAAYSDDTASFEAYREELLTMLTVNPALMPDDLPRRYAGEDYNDFHLIEDLAERKNDLHAFPQRIQKNITAAEHQARDLMRLGYDADSYEVAAQLQCAERYRFVGQNVQIPDLYAYGYDVLLQNNAVLPFVGVFALFSVLYVFLLEKSTGFDGVLYTTPRGRRQNRWAKLKAACLVSVTGTCLLLSAAALAVGLACGYSSPSAPVQIFSVFRNVPLAITCAGYVFLQSVMRLFVVTVFTVFIALVTQATQNFLLPILAAAGGIWLNVLLFEYEYLGTKPAVYYMNFAAWAQGLVPTSFYRSFSLFGVAVPQNAVFVVFVVMITAAMGLILVFVTGEKKKHISVHNGRRKLASSVCGGWNSMDERPVIRNEKRRKKLPSLHLLTYEIKKTRPFLLAVLLVFLLFLRGSFLRLSVGSMESYKEALYYTYIEMLQSLPDDEINGYVGAERARIDGILAEAKTKEKLYRSGAMSGEAYYTYLEDYHRAEDESAVFAEVESYVSYVQSKQAGGLTNADYIYTHGYERYFGLHDDLFLLLSLMIVSVTSFTVEHGSSRKDGTDFSAVLCSTPLGRQKTFWCKCLYNAFLSGLIAVCYGVVAFYCVRVGWEMEKPDATLCSIPIFSGLSSSLTIRAYTWLSMIRLFLVGAVLSVSVCCISCLCRRLQQAAVLSSLVIVLPELTERLRTIGKSVWLPGSATAPGVWLRQSAQRQWLQNDLTFSAVRLLICLLVAVVLAVITKNIYCRRGLPNKVHKRKEKGDEGLWNCN